MCHITTRYWRSLYNALGGIATNFLFGYFFLVFLEDVLIRNVINTDQWPLNWPVVHFNCTYSSFNLSFCFTYVLNISSFYLSFSFNVSSGDLDGLLDGFSLSEAIESNKLFIVNHSILDGMLDTENKQIVSVYILCTIVCTIPLNLWFSFV